MDKYKVYFTYRLYITSGSTTTPDIKTNPVHCNYINYKEFDSLTNKFIYLKFPNEDEFRFMNPSGHTGFVADTFEILVQIVPPDEELQPDKWKIFNKTSEIDSHSVGNLINKTNLVNTIFEIKLSDYLTNNNYYVINYNNYPTRLESDALGFGDEEYLIGNVETDIGATAYTTDLQLTMPTMTFNYSTNKTWTEGEDIYVSEIGLYDNENNLVGIGKLNRPIKKNNKTSRTFVFEIDF